MTAQDCTKEILERAQSGNTDAFGSLYEELVDRVFRYVSARVSDREQAKEITQDAFVSIWEGLHRFTYQSEDQWYGYVFLIVRRRLIDSRRRHRDEALVSASELDQSAGEIAPAVDPFDQARLRESVAQLPARMREVMHQRYWAGLSFASIGRALGVSENHARVLHHRAIKALHTTYSTHEA